MIVGHVLTLDSKIQFLLRNTLWKYVPIYIRYIFINRYTMCIIMDKQKVHNVCIVYAH